MLVIAEQKKEANSLLSSELASIHYISNSYLCCFACYENKAKSYLNIECENIKHISGFNRAVSLNEKLIRVYRNMFTHTNLDYHF
jgi:nicotinamide mononucleotide (NMN) deamidase PncC